ncbi:hypothetical protein FYJ27_01635 [Anaerosalibacter bizertensis]|uniref:Uncharacterized protein n=1 Tax=Anaerosalibacter bizertensis TaxID=932217 RepID=A0A844FEN0_9FIRM|nr:hypothetical protein [Anaerosalibacter bizertensis]MSS42439.1 hypothetical protein [Anaerosalibacter bizertensis]
MAVTFKDYNFEVVTEKLKCGKYRDTVEKIIIKNNSDIKYSKDFIEGFFLFLYPGAVNKYLKFRQWSQPYYEVEKKNDRTFEFILTKPYLG